ncbi:wax ester/triacylglycerol synthase domain-containing protein [Actinoplanes sp. NPDC049316]|uniref:wax ester/triacylglycerol synthase domain-containing protein n=1 Tax=Actinoplanes sp. NPDC049316 TaxID=3154727 RepID=UPI00341B2E3A
MAVNAEPVNDADLAFLAMDTGAVPVQFAAVLELDRRIDPALAARLLAERVPRTRLGQHITARGPLRRPVWQDDQSFDVARHLELRHCPPPGDEPALTALAMEVLLRRLPRDRPLWRAAIVDGLAGGGSALIIVVHHVVADGINGMTILGRLADRLAAGEDPRPAPPPPAAPPRPSPPMRRIARLRRLVLATVAAGGLAPERAEPCSLTGRTGPHRRAAVVTAGVPGLRATAHRHGATVHAALLVAVASTLHRVLARRGESVGSVVMAVPVAGDHDGPGSPGTVASPMLITVAADGPVGDRLHAVAEAVRRRRALAAGLAPIAVAGRPFRLIARLGGYAWYMRRQRRLHTLVSFVRGPERPLRFGGATIRRLIPLVVGGETNVTVAFQAISYAGTLAVTAVADPQTCPDLPVLGAYLAEELTRLGGAQAGPPGPPDATIGPGSARDARAQSK